MAPDAGSCGTLRGGGNSLGDHLLAMTAELERRLTRPYPSSEPATRSTATWRLNIGVARGSHVIRSWPC